jgi:hypothetical protein
MAITTFTITIFLSMIALLFAIISGHYFGREPNTGILVAIFIFAIVIPVGIAILSIPLYNIAFYDWPSIAYILPPQFIIFAAAFFGGLIGFKSAEIWNQGEASCIRCLLSLVIVSTLLTLLIVLLP